MQETLKSVTEQNYITWPNTKTAGFEVLVLSLKNSPKKHGDVIYLFLDNCFIRSAKNTVVYTDHLDALVHLVQAKGEELDSRGLPDLLMIILMEQLPYLTAKHSGEAVIAVAQFLRLYVDFSLTRGVNRSLLLLIRNTMMECFGKQDECPVLIGHALQEPLDGNIQTAFNQSFLKTNGGVDDVRAVATSVGLSTQMEVIIPLGPPAEDENHRGLTRWAREDIQDAIADGAIEELILCLCSEYEEVRRQALMSIRNFIQKLEVRSLDGDAGPC